jgi:peptidylprolyl isomerase
MLARGRRGLVLCLAVVSLVSLSGYGCNSDAPPALSGPHAQTPAPPVVAAPSRQAPPPNTLPTPPPNAKPAPPAPKPLDAQRAELESFMQRGLAASPKPLQPGDLLPSDDGPTPVDMGTLKRLPSGVEYVDLLEGLGPEVGSNDLFAAHITTWSSSGQRLGQQQGLRSRPRVFDGLKALPVPALREALAGMRLGSRRLLVLPPGMLSHSKQPGRGPIPADALVVMEVAVVNVAYLDPTFPKPGVEAASSYDPEKVQTTSSGLQYVDLVEGMGASPKVGQTVVVHYTGWLTEGGKRFDSSVVSGEPFSFVIGHGEVIQGWDEGVATMREGGKRLLIIPASLGYKEKGAGEDIPPNASLTFEITLYTAI